LKEAVAGRQLVAWCGGGQRLVATLIPIDEARKAAKTCEEGVKKR
jgi:hypothetical protein